LLYLAIFLSDAAAAALPACTALCETYDAASVWTTVMFHYYYYYYYIRSTEAIEYVVAFSLRSHCAPGTGLNVDRSKASRALGSSNPSTAMSTASSVKSSSSTGGLRSWTSQAISAATSKESDSLYRKVGIAT